MLPTHRKPTLPGKILLEEFLIPLTISQSEFVKHLGGSWTQLKLKRNYMWKEIYNRRNCSQDLADALGTSPEFWIGLQTDVHLWEAAQRRKKISRIKTKKLILTR